MWASCAGKPACSTTCPVRVRLCHTAAVALGLPLADHVHEDRTHHLAGIDEKTRPIRKLQVLRLAELQVRLVHERGRVEHDVAAAFAQPSGRDPAQFVVRGGEETVDGAVVRRWEPGSSRDDSSPGLGAWSNLATARRARPRQRAPDAADAGNVRARPVRILDEAQWCAGRTGPRRGTRARDRSSGRSRRTQSERRAPPARSDAPGNHDVHLVARTLSCVKRHALPLMSHSVCTMETGRGFFIFLHGKERMNGLHARDIANARSANPARGANANGLSVPEAHDANPQQPLASSPFALGVWRHRETLFVAALIAVWLAATAWARPLMLPDEGRYAGVAWEMLRSGDWLTPTLNGLPFFHKPPLFYWITAGSLATFGMNAWAARAAPLLGAFVGALALYLFQRRWSGRSAARATLVVLLVQPLFYAGAQFANLDMLVAGCITGTVLLLAHAALCLERGLPYRAPLLGAYAMAALGVLAKGLIGAVIPALIVGLWLVWMRRWRTLRGLVHLGAIAVFLALVLPWFVAMQWRFDAFFDYFFVVQQVQRFAGGGFNNAQPFWFYPVVLAVLSLSWLPALYRLLRAGTAGQPTEQPIRVLLWVWIGVVVVFFSLPESKLLGYVLPAVPPLAALFADGMRVAGGDAARQRRRWGAAVALSVAVSLGAVAFFALRPMDTTEEIGAALGRQRGANDAVVMLDQYYFDVPFEARLQRPVKVVADWSSPDVLKHDNWRKELADASRFAPGLARSVLIGAASLRAELCDTRVSWVIGPVTAASAYPFLAQVGAAATRRATALWRIDASRPETAAALGCNTAPERLPDRFSAARLARPALPGATRR